jgi:PIN domain
VLHTVSENLEVAAASLCALLDALFPDNVLLRDLNQTGSNVFLVGPSHVFPELNSEQRRTRSRIGADLDHFLAVVHTLLDSQPAAVQRSISKAEKHLRAVAGQSRVSQRSTNEAKASLRKSLDELLALISDLHDDAEGCVLLVPDTNALLSSPSLESWTYGDIEAFQLVLVPSVLAELDELKVNHRNPDVRDKANALIRQVKEFRRRGKLTDGVPVVHNRITLRALAVEPDLNSSLPWLDRTNADDRILASCIEVMRAHPRAAVELVTGDINLQNKAEFALVPFLEPPGVH